MSKPISFVPNHRLASLLRSGGGVTVNEAVSRAGQRLDAVREQCIAALDEKISALAAESSRAHAAPQVYSLATEIYSLAGTFGLTELAQAASSLCDLLVNASGGQANPKYLESVRVHIDALRTLRRPELSGDVAGRVAVVQGLRRVASRTTLNGEGGG
jgi:HPt (histidine-containing phosphotransfer) domain-containing protein